MFRVRWATVVASLIAALMAFIGVATFAAMPANATAYRFWSYWLGDTSGWSFSSQGASRVPPDGSVDGWRFAVSEATSSSSPPRASSSFQDICGSTPPSDDNKRVGLVVDFGTTLEAPDGESPHSTIVTCVVAPTDATGYDILSTVVSLRVDDGLICGMDGYPATECGAAVADPPTSGPGPSSNPPGGNGGGTNGGSTTTNGGAGGGAGGAGGAGTTSGSGSPGLHTSTKHAGSGGKGTKASNHDLSEKEKASAKRATRPAESTPTLSPKGDDTTSALIDNTPASTTGENRGSTFGLLVGLVVIAGLAAAAFVVKWRRT